MPKEKIQDIIIKKRAVIKKTAEIFNSRTKIPTGKIVFGILLFLLFAILGAKIIKAFSSTTIQLKLHNEKINVDTIIKAGKGTGADLNFETMEMEIAKQETKESTGVKTVNTKASGQIIVYNNYSSESQPLITNTRFETPDGKTYRINKHITVPGKGSLEVTVYADQPGEEYNIGLSDFTIPGLKGLPQYEKVYARSKTEMTGGLKGEMPVISEEDLNQLKTGLQNKIEKELMEKIETQKPNGYIVFKNSIKINFDDKIISGEKGNSFTLVETGSLLAYLLPKEKLSSVLVKKYLGEEFQNKVQVKNLEDLNFTLISDDNAGLVVFKLTGQADFVWKIEDEELKKALIASPKNTEEVFKNYPSIEQANVVFKPSWWRFLPNKTSRINIESL